MYNIIFSLNKFSFRSLTETVKYLNTSSIKLQPRGRKSFIGIRDPNPGIQNQLNNLDSEDSFVDGTDCLEETESDFMRLDQMHRLHVKEKEERRRVVQHKIVGHKYFKPLKNPNLLTWSEKEQIRYLYNSDTEKWNIEKLAQSFPASQEIIQKILKSNWQPSDSSRIVKHDQVVQRNWELLRSGKLNIDSELKEHVIQFTGRTVPRHQHILDPSVEEKWRPKPARTEFGNIIESYKRLKGEEIDESPDVIHRSRKDLVEPKNDSYVMANESESYMRYGRSTLERYRERIETTIKEGQSPSPDVRLMLKHPVSDQVHSNAPVLDDLLEQQNVEIELPKDLPKDDFPPESIRIPHNKWRRGATFKMGDCYYDDDGSFLYRVPGMK